MRLLADIEGSGSAGDIEFRLSGADGLADGCRYSILAGGRDNTLSLTVLSTVPI